MFFTNCKKEPGETTFLIARKTGDHLTMAAICSEHELKKYKEDCNFALKKSEDQIQDILSGVQKTPFFKMMLPKEEASKIEELLKKNVLLGIRYRYIWQQSAEKYSD
jgi:hypothetical protein